MNERLLQYQDYLHGEVVDDEDQAACYYEYARTSKVLQWAAKLLHGGRRRVKDYGYIQDGDQQIPHPANLVDDVRQRTAQRFKCFNWFDQGHWPSIWQCSSFPRLSWNELESGERKLIADQFPPINVQPLHMNEVWELDTIGIFSDLKVMSIEAQAAIEDSIKEKTKAPRVYPIIHLKGPGKEHFTHALFTLDFRESKNVMLARFAAWLDKEENKRRLEMYKEDSTGTTGTYKDGLKALAVLHLKSALKTFTAVQKFAQRNRKKFPADRVWTDKKTRYRAGEYMPFRDARTGQSEKVALNKADLFSERSGMDDAIARAKDFQRKIMHWEFGEQPEAQAGREMGEKFRKQISKKNS